MTAWPQESGSNRYWAWIPSSRSSPISPSVSSRKPSWSGRTLRQPRSSLRHTVSTSTSIHGERGSHGSYPNGRKLTSSAMSLTFSLLLFPNSPRSRVCLLSLRRHIPCPPFTPRRSTRPSLVPVVLRRSEIHWRYPSQSPSSKPYRHADRHRDLRAVV